MALAPKTQAVTTRRARTCLASGSIDSLASLVSDMEETVNKAAESPDASQVPVNPPLFVLVAERAQQLQLSPASVSSSSTGDGPSGTDPTFVDIAKRALSLFFGVDQPLRGHPKWTARALFCKALIKAASRGDFEDKARLAALDILLEGIDIAVSVSHNALIYNGSILFWRIARGMMRSKKGEISKLIPGLTKVAAALRNCSDTEDPVWSAKVHLFLAAAQLSDQSASEDAATACDKTIALAYKIIPKGDDFSLDEVYRIQLSMGLRTKNLVKTKIKGLALSAMAPVYATGIMDDIPQKGSNVLSVLDDAKNALLDIKGVGNPGDREENNWTDEDEKERQEALSFLVSLGRAALHADVSENDSGDGTDFAISCTDKVISAENAEKAVIDAEFLLCEITLRKSTIRLPGMDAENLYSTTSVRLRKKLLVRLRTTLRKALSLKDQELSQRGALLVWNCCLPLLQPNLRKEIRSDLEATSAALETANSNCVDVRCSINLELAKIAYDAQLFSLVEHYLNLAESFNPEGRFSSKINIARDLLFASTPDKIPENVPTEQKVEAAIQQALQAEHPKLQRAMLVKAAGYLYPDCFGTELIPALERLNHSNDGNHTSRDDLVDALEREKILSKLVSDFIPTSLGIDNFNHFRVHISLCRTARKLKIWDVAATISSFTLTLGKNLFNSEKDALPLEEMQGYLMERAHVYNIRAEASIQILSALQFKVGQEGHQSLMSLNDGIQNKNSNVLKKDVHFNDKDIHIIKWLRSSVLNALKDFVEAAKIGQQIKQAWITQNSGVCLLNYTKHLMENSKYKQYIEIYDELRECLKLTLEDNDGYSRQRDLCLLYAETCIIVSRCFLSQYKSIVDAESLSTSSPSQGKKGGSAPKVASADQEPVIEALTIAETAINVIKDISYVAKSKAFSTMLEALLYLRRPLEYDWSTHDCFSKSILAVEFLASKANSINHQDESQFELQTNEDITVHYAFDSLKHCEEVKKSLRTKKTTVKQSRIEKSKVFGTYSRLFAMHLWARLSTVALHAKEYSVAKDSASRVLTMHHALIKRHGVASSVSVQEHELCNTACVVQGLVAIDSINDAIEQNENQHTRMKVVSLNAFSSAMMHAFKASSMSLMIEATKYVWNSGLKLCDSSAHRAYVYEPFKSALQHIAKKEKRCPTKELIDLRQRMYEILFLCCSDSERWSDGIKLIEHAVSALPRSIVSFVAKYRMAFKLRLGQSTSFSTQLVEESAETRSEIWRTMARIAPSFEAKKQAYEQAISVAGEVQELNVIRAEYMIDFVTWLTSTDEHQDFENMTSMLEQAAKTALSSLNKNSHSGDNLEKQVSPVFQEIRLYEIAFRAHVMLAIARGSDTTRQSCNCILACQILAHMWRVLIKRANFLQHEKDRSDGNQTKKGKKEAGKPQDAFPMPPTEDLKWIRYIPDERSLHLLAEDTGSPQSLNTNTIPRPELFLHYLFSLSSLMKNINLHHKCFPVLLMAWQVLRPKSESGLIPIRAGEVLVKLQLVELCRDLNLPDDSKFYDIQVGDPSPNQDEKMSQRSVSHHYIKHVKKGKVIRKHERHNSVFPLKPIRTYHFWMETSEILLKRGSIEKAQHLILETRLAATAHNDAKILDRIKLCEATLMLLRDGPGKAMNILLSIDPTKTSHEPQFWFDYTSLLANVTSYRMKAQILSNDVDIDISQVENAIVHNCQLLSDIAQENSVDCSNLLYNKALLESCLGKLHFQTYKQLKSISLISSDSLEERLRTAEKLLKSSTDTLEMLGRVKEYAEILIHGANISQEVDHFDSFAKDKSRDAGNIFQNNARQMLLKAESALQNLISTLNIPNSCTLGAVHPTMQLLAKIKIKIGQIDYGIFKNSIDIYVERLKEESKPKTIEKIISTYIHEGDTNIFGTFGFKNPILPLGDEAIGRFSSIEQIAGPIHELKALAHLGIGMVLSQSRRASLEKAFKGDAQNVWEYEAIEKAREARNKKISTNEAIPVVINEENESADRSTGLSDTYEVEDIDCDKPIIDGTDRTLEMNQSQFTKEPREDNYSCGSIENRFEAREYMRQSVDSLKVAVDCALRKDNYSTVALASQVIMDLCGTVDSRTTTVYMNYFLSCSAQNFLSSLHRRSCPSSASNREKALLNLYDHVKNNYGMVNVSDFERLSNILTKESPPWQRLKVRSEMFSVFQLLPQNCRIISLITSDNGKYIYGSIGSPASLSIGGKDLPKVFRVSVDPSELERAIECFENFKSILTREILFYERPEDLKEKNSPEFLKSQMETDGEEKSKSEVENMALDKDGKMIEIHHPMMRTASVANIKMNITNHFEDRLEEEEPEQSEADDALATAIATTTRYLATVSRELDGYLDDDDISVVLLCSHSLLSLPLESLPFLQKSNITSISRDFSLQTLFNRLQPPEAFSDNDEGEGDDKDKKKGKGSKKGESENIIAETSRVKIIVDPKGDFNTSHSNDQPCVVYKNMRDENSTIMSKWTGILGPDAAPVLQEIQHVMSSGSAFLYYGIGRLLSKILPDQFSGVNMTKCKFAWLIDRATNEHELGKQTALDAAKIQARLRLEDPRETAALMYLRGISGIAMNFWSTSEWDNRDRFLLILKGILAGAERNWSVSQAVRVISNSSLRNSLKNIGGGGKKGGSKPKSAKKEKENPPPETDEYLARSDSFKFCTNS
eukprot:UC4_evm2s1200